LGVPILWARKERVQKILSDVRDKGTIDELRLQNAHYRTNFTFNRYGIPMSSDHPQKIARKLTISEKQVSAVITLLEEGSTVPFISRYRKEATGSLDEVAIQEIRDQREGLIQLDKRRDSILASLEEREMLTRELKSKITNAETLTELEDIYLSYKPKRRTRATVAREKGLEALARQLYAQQGSPINAQPFVNTEKEVNTVEDAWAGAQDIIAEWVTEDANVRSMLRNLFAKHAQLESNVVKKKIEEAEKFKDYFDWKEPLSKAPSHRVLAILRGHSNGFLSIKARPETDATVKQLQRYLIKNQNAAELPRLNAAFEDAYKRLLMPSLETELLNEAKETADLEAINVFAANLRELLLSSPLGQKHILAVDPGFRTGCKVVELDKQGKLLQNFTIFPTQGAGLAREAGEKITKTCTSKKIEAIAVGNGTGGRETEEFLNGLGLGIPVISVNESGASIYSASKVARDEFPDHDLTVRGAVSIGRRLQDPLAELVKLDPKSIGVGQYQHDVDQTRLKKSLDDVVESCVNAVGVEVNSASLQLLTYVAGLGPQRAANIIKYRNDNGAFSSRAELKKVPRLGAKAFEQAAGFLRIGGAKNPLDASAVHPETYSIVKDMAKDQGCSVQDLIADKTTRDAIDLSKYSTETVGLPTLTDIVAELDKPGRDPRPEFEVFSFSSAVHGIGDLKEGMKLPGIVTNVTKFGAFVDVGAHQDGLVHISQLADRYIRDPHEIVKVNQKVEVTVIEVDIKRKRIALSMKSGK
jgi:protein Tex